MATTEQSAPATPSEARRRVEPNPLDLPSEDSLLRIKLLNVNQVAVYKVTSAMGRMITCQLQFVEELPEAGKEA